MIRPRPWWLIVEFAVLFGPAIGVLLQGMIFAPVMLIAVWGRSGGDWGVALAMVVAGAWGVVSAFGLLRHLFLGRRWSGSVLQHVGLGLGAVAALAAAVQAPSGPVAVLFAAPVLGAAHLLLLARRAHRASLE